MEDISKASDDELLGWSSAGNEEAFVTLYRRRQSGIYRFVLHMTGNSMIAEEVTQEVFLTVIREGERFDASRGTAASYLFGVARNHMKRLLEKEGKFVTWDISEDAMDTTADESPGPLATITQDEEIAALRAAVLSLPAAYREVIALCDLQEMSYADAASLLRTPVGTVRSRLSRGRALLADKLKGAEAAGRHAARTAGGSHA